MKFKKFALFLVAAVLPIIAYTVKAQSNTVYDPAPLDTIYPIQDNSAPALVALAAMYAPMENEGGWIKMVCTGMTEGGCAYFKDNQASDTWESQSSNIGSSSGFIANVKTINEDAQVWKAQVTVFTPGRDTTSDVFALVRRDNDGRWFLDRILSGPGISLQ
jgi:hypothetical protein